MGKIIAEMVDGKIVPICELTDFDIKAISVALYHQWHNTTDDDAKAVTCSQEMADTTYKMKELFEKLRKKNEGISNTINSNITSAVNYAEELRMLVSSLCEDVKDSESMTEAWKKVDSFYRDAEAMRNCQKCTGSKSFSVLQEEVDGHTKYLQGLNLPIMVNTIWEEENHCIPSKVCEMHIGIVDGNPTLLITPEHIVLPDREDKKPETGQTQKYKDMDNSEIRRISYEECPLKCTGCEALCDEMPVGQCRTNLSQKFD